MICRKGDSAAIKTDLALRYEQGPGRLTGRETAGALPASALHGNYGWSIPASAWQEGDEAGVAKRSGRCRQALRSSAEIAPKATDKDAGPVQPDHGTDRRLMGSRLPAETRTFPTSGRLAIMSRALKNATTTFGRCCCYRMAEQAAG